MEDIPEIKFLKFSFNGNYILLGSTDNQINLIDAFEGKKVRKVDFFKSENLVAQIHFQFQRPRNNARWGGVHTRFKVCDDGEWDQP